MKHTLIPTSERKRLHREYYIRVLIVMLCMLSISVLIGAGALFPAYVKAWISYRAAQAEIAAIRGSKIDAGIDAASKDLARDSELAAVLSDSDGVSRLSDAVRSVISVKGPVSIASFSLDREGGGAVSVSVSGVSPTRDELIAFRSRIEAMIPGTSVDLPISQLAKNSDIPFTFRFTIQSK